MRRGDLVTIVLSGDYGKPRPGLIIQADAFAMLASIAVIPLSGTLIDMPLLRIDVEPTVETGLRKSSQIMIDKITTMPRSKVGQRLGRIDAQTMHAVDVALARFLGLPFKP